MAPAFDFMVGACAAMRSVFDVIERVAATDLTVLILGETGTGKELVARSLHRRSERKAGRFVALNCGALPSTLIESELFGFEKGTFTGAAEAHVGHIESADGGTLFLDEIAEMPVVLQAKLLRVLQDRCVQRLGGKRGRAVDVRFLAATHQDLPHLVEAGAFRRDLFHRLDEVRIRLPPLRERDGDIELIAQSTLVRLAGEGTPAPILSPEALVALRQHPWPGNVRELENTLKRAVLLGGAATLTVADLQLAPDGAERTLAEIVRAAEENAIRGAMRRHDGDRAAVARELDIDPARLEALLQSLDQGSG